MYYVGVDLHKAQSWFYVMNESGKRIISKSISNQPRALKEFFESIPQPFKVAVESTYNSYFPLDIAEEYTDMIYLTDPCELKAFAKRHKKTDKIDARLIADVLRKGYLPVVTIPDKETRKMRDILRYRRNLVFDRARNIHRLKALLDKLGENSYGNFILYKKLNQIDTSHLSEEHQQLISGYVEQIASLTNRVFRFDTFIRKQACKDEDIMNLTSIPGISYFSAALIKSEIVDINRFASFSRLCAYAGLSPRVYQSANRLVHGPLNVNRRKQLQWIIIEIAFHFIRALPEKAEKYLRIARRKSHNTAKVVLSRDLLKIIYHVLKEKRSFYKTERQKQYKIRSLAASAAHGGMKCLQGSFEASV